MKKNFLIIIFLCSLLNIIGCKKENCWAGKGGNYDFVIYPRHHGEAIPGATVYVAYNTQSSPGSLANFNLTKQGSAAEDHINLYNMRCGDYYIYCAGLDTAGPEIVKGGIPYSVANYSGGTITIYIPVTE